MSKEYTCLGMMSGTSGDGVDIDNSVKWYRHPIFLKEKYFEYDDKLFRVS